MPLRPSEQPLPHAVYTIGTVLARQTILAIDPNLKTFCVILKQVEARLINLFLEHYFTSDYLISHLYFNTYLLYFALLD